MVVSVNKSFPIKVKTQVKLGHPWAPLGTICTLDIVDIFGRNYWKLYSFGLRAKFIKIQNTC